jgi:hypothetical protein
MICRMLAVGSAARTVTCTMQTSAQLRRHPLVMVQQSTEPFPAHDIPVTGRRQSAFFEIKRRIFRDEAASIKAGLLATNHSFGENARSNLS